MTSTVPEREPLGATTLNRKWYLDIDTGTDPATPTWTGVFGITEFQPAVEPQLQDDSDFDSGGWGSQMNTQNNWSCTGKVRRGTIGGDSPDPTSYDPGQEALRLAGTSVGLDNVVHVRFYEMTPDGPRVEAYEGKAAVTWSPDGGDTTALDIVSFTLSGRGERKSITHPDSTT